MRSLQRTSIALGLMLLSGMLSLLLVAPALAETTTIQITDVNNSLTAADEWFQIYNMTKSPITLTNWSACTSNTCITLPTMTVEAFSIAKIKASSLQGWPTKGLDGANDMLGLKDQDGKAIDSLNWGAPSSSWKNYDAFKSMLWNPGIAVRDPNINQAYFRAAIGKDSDQPSDWLTAVGKSSGTGSATPAPAVATATPGSATGGTIKPNTTPTKNPTTGGGFPFMLAVGLIIVVFAIRYFRRNLAPQRDLQ